MIYGNVAMVASHSKWMWGYFFSSLLALIGSYAFLFPYFKQLKP